MSPITFYKLTTVILIIIAAGTTSGTALYYQQQSTALANRITTLNNDLNSTQHQLDTQTTQIDTQTTKLDAQTTQINQLQNTNSQLLTTNAQLASTLQQLQGQVNSLQGQLANLTKTIPKTNYTLVSSGSIAIYEYGPAQFIRFTPTLSQTKLNVTFSGGLTIAMLLNQSQYDTFLTCNCYNYDNYTSSTWSSPASTFYTTIIAIPARNTWYVAFVEPANNPNRGYFTDTETLQLIST
jgi:ABC-type transporter Mla subunit MlaD